jgi:hypothetical protein
VLLCHRGRWQWEESTLPSTGPFDLGTLRRRSPKHTTCHQQSVTASWARGQRPERAPLDVGRKAPPWDPIDGRATGFLAANLPHRGRPIHPGVVRRPADLEQPAHHVDREAGLLSLDQPVLAHRFCSVAKPLLFQELTLHPQRLVVPAQLRGLSPLADAQLRLLIGMLNQPQVDPVPNVPSRTPMSRATTAIGFPVSRTSLTASGVNFRLCCPAAFPDSSSRGYKPRLSVST